MNWRRRMRQWFGEPPMSYIPMLPAALLITIAALLAVILKKNDIHYCDEAGKRTYVGVIADVRRYDVAQRCVVSLDSCKAEIYVAATQPRLYPGDTVRFEATLTPLRKAVEPDEFDYAQFMRRKGVTLSGYVPSEKFSVTKPERRGLAAKLRDIASRTADKLDSSGLDDNAIVFFKAALLGDTSEARTTIGPRFSAAGLAHVLALSGTHVAALYMVFTVLMFPLYLFRRRIMLVVCVTALLWVYALLTGMTASVVRAVVMATCFSAGFVVQRSGSSFNSWLVAWTLLLAADADNLLDVGFQMSFAATGAILLFLPQFSVLSGRIHHRISRWIAVAVGVSVAAMAGSGIVAAYHFHTLPLLFLIANLPVGLLLPWLLGGGFLLCLMLWAGFDAHWLCVCLNWLYGCVDKIAAGIGGIEWGQLRHVWFSGWCMLPYFVTLLCVAYALWQRSDRRAWLSVAGLVVSTVISFAVGSRHRSAEEWFVTTAGGNTAIVVSHGSGVDYMTPLNGQLRENSKADAQKVLVNYLSRRNVDSLTTDNRQLAAVTNIGRKRIAYLYNDSMLAKSYPEKVDYLIVGRQYKGTIGAAVEYFRPDTVLLASEMHWRRRQKWIDTLSNSAVPCIWLRNHRFGIRSVDNR